jgi:hypothetical protein
LKQALGLDAELVRGSSGEFTVWVDDQMVVKKGWFGFPSEQEIVEAVRQALG